MANGKNKPADFSNQHPDESDVPPDDQLKDSARRHVADPEDPDAAAWLEVVERTKPTRLLPEPDDEAQP